MATPRSVNPYLTDTSNRSAQYQRFPAEYFSGADTRIYFGEEWIDEITNLSFSLVENVQPIFGYASYTYDAVARGSRQIQGQFSINFKESYYLHFVTNRLEQKMKGLKEGGTTGVSASEQQFNNGITLEHLLSKAASDSTDSFEKYANMFEQSLWGATDNESTTYRTNNRSSESYFFPESGRSNLSKDGFNIVILYGAYGDVATTKNLESTSRTAHTLVGVHLTGVSQIVDSSGSPVQEVYSFIAKDLDSNINLQA